MGERPRLVHAVGVLKPEGQRTERAGVGVRALDRETHGSITRRNTYDALEELFTGWEAPPEVATVKALQAH